MKNGHDHLPNVQVLAKSKWESSGIDEKTAKRLRLTPVANAQSLAPHFHNLPALQIPYFTAEGKPSDFYRIRYLAKPKGLAGLVEKLPRYAQPAKTLNEIYMPPLFMDSWANIGEDAERPLIITEGELKAASACDAGLVCVGLGGVDMWRSGNRGLAMLPQLERIKWSNRRVHIAFDSDAATNPNVIKAQLRLARELTARGGLVHIVSIPARPNGEKQGLDDFLVAAGGNDDAESAWVALVEENGKLLDEGCALWKLNTEVVYIRDPGLMVVVEGGFKMSHRAFVDHAYANRSFMEQQINAKGEPKQVRKPLAPQWLAWPARYELKRITYSPGEPGVTDKQEYNDWHGWGCEPKKGDVGPWRTLLDYMFEGLPKERQWFERWCAYPLQHPGTKMYSSVLVWGATQGTGKTLIGYTLMDVYGRRGDRENSVEIKNKDLESGDNDWAKNKQFVVGDEISSSDKRHDADYIKNIITREEVRINIKYVPKYVVPDHINYYFTSQHPDALFVEDTDRRYFVHQAPSLPMSRDFYKLYDVWRKNGGPSHVFHHLLNIDLGDFDPNAHALSSAAKRSMIMDSKSELGAWIAGLREETEGFLTPLGMRAAASAALLTSAQILRCYDPEHATKVTHVGMGKELKRAGFQMYNAGAPVRTTVGVQRLYIVRDLEKWLRASKLDVAAHWNAMFGPEANKISPKKGAKKK